MSDLMKQRLPLDLHVRKLQAFNDAMLTHLLVLCDMTDKGQGPPNVATAVEAVKRTIRLATQAFQETA